MAKLTFVYGCMGAGKSLQLLIERYNLIEQGKRVEVFKSAVDTRSYDIQSRVGLSCHVKYPLLNKGTVAGRAVAIQEWVKDLDYILVDEAQFLDAEWIGILQSITLNQDIPVTCYGLKTDFKSKLFEGSKRLLEIADEIIEIKVKCKHCLNDALFNMRVDEDGLKVYDGEAIKIGGNESYQSVCKLHYYGRGK